MRRRISGSQEYNWHCVIGGEDYDNCNVHVFIQPPEPDVNEPGGMEIESIAHAGRDITDDATDDELNTIAMDLYEYLNDMEQAYD